MIFSVCYQLKQLKKQPEKKNAGLNGIRTHELAIPVQCFIHKPHGLMVNCEFVIYSMIMNIYECLKMSFMFSWQEQYLRCEYECMKIIHMNCG